MAHIKNPSAKLTDPSNVARPQLTKHCTSIACVQLTTSTTPSATTALPDEADSGSKLRHANQSVTACIDQDIEVMEIEDPESEKTGNKKSNMDLDYFFEPSTAPSGTEKNSQHINHEAIK
ncbi:hypothetical protein C0995_005317 [Termitomyces sp. Mi166|nr:hypothetical protein C0995_005317 [Termitomyces sp. Mi166\